MRFIANLSPIIKDLSFIGKPLQRGGLLKIVPTLDLADLSVAFFLFAYPTLSRAAPPNQEGVGQGCRSVTCGAYMTEQYTPIGITIYEKVRPSIMGYISSVS